MIAALQFNLYAGLAIAAYTPSATGLMSNISSAAKHVAGSDSNTNSKKRDFMAGSFQGAGYVAPRSLLQLKRRPKPPISRITHYKPDMPSRLPALDSLFRRPGLQVRLAQVEAPDFSRGSGAFRRRGRGITLHNRL